MVSEDADNINQTSMLPILGLINLPTPVELLTGTDTAPLATSTAGYAGAIFTELAEYAFLVVGLLLGALFVRFIVMGGLKGSVMKLIGGRRGGKRRRR